jgi:hypothetical protein
MWEKSRASQKDMFSGTKRQISSTQLSQNFFEIAWKFKAKTVFVSNFFGSHQWLSYLFASSKYKVPF